MHSINAELFVFWEISVDVCWFPLKKSRLVAHSLLSHRFVRKKTYLPSGIASHIVVAFYGSHVKMVSFMALLKFLHYNRAYCDGSHLPTSQIPSKILTMPSTEASNTTDYPYYFVHVSTLTWFIQVRLHIYCNNQQL